MVTDLWFTFTGPEYGQVKLFTTFLIRPLRPVIGVVLWLVVKIGWIPYVTIVSSFCPELQTIPAVHLEWFDNILGQWYFIGLVSESDSSCKCSSITFLGIWLVIKQDNLGKLALEKQNHSGFYWSKRWWGGNCISWTIWKLFTPCSRQMTMPVPTSPLSFCRPDAIPATHLTASKHWRQYTQIERQNKKPDSTTFPNFLRRCHKMPKSKKWQNLSLSTAWMQPIIPVVWHFIGEQLNGDSSPGDN